MSSCKEGAFITLVSVLCYLSSLGLLLAPAEEASSEDHF